MASPQLFKVQGPVTGISATGNTSIAKFLVQGMERIYIQWDLATQALDAFVVNGRAHESAAMVPLVTSGYGTPVGIIVSSSGDVAAQTAGTTGFLGINVLGLYEIELQVSAAVNGAVISNIYAGGA